MTSLSVFSVVLIICVVVLIIALLRATRQTLRYKKHAEEHILMQKRTQDLRLNKKALCVPLTVLQRHAKGSKLDILALKPEHVNFLDRSLCDDLSANNLKIAQSLVQLIPYVTLTHKGKFAVYRRKAKNNLKGKLSLGFGGHIDMTDALSTNLVETIDKAIYRELEEELNIKKDKDFYVDSTSTVLDILLDNSSTINSVHAGIHYNFEVAHTDIQSKEQDELDDIQWMSFGELCHKKHEFETWSQIIILRNLLM